MTHILVLAVFNIQILFMVYVIGKILGITPHPEKIIIIIKNILYLDGFMVSN